MSSPDGEPTPAEGGPTSRQDEPERPAVFPIRVAPKVIVLLSVGMVAALLIFGLEPSYTLRYIVCGILGAAYVFLRFNDWR